MWTWVWAERQAEELKKREREKWRETERKAQHQQGFSLVKQEVWRTKGQTEGLFQSAALLSHCFHSNSWMHSLYRFSFVSLKELFQKSLAGVFVFSLASMQL